MELKYKVAGNYIMIYTECAMYESQHLMADTIAKVMAVNPYFELHTVNTQIDRGGRCYLTLIFKRN